VRNSLGASDGIERCVGQTGHLALRYAATLRLMPPKDADGPNLLTIRVTGYQFPDALDPRKRFS